MQLKSNEGCVIHYFWEVTPTLWCYYLFTVLFIIPWCRSVFFPFYNSLLLFLFLARALLKESQVGCHSKSFHSSWRSGIHLHLIFLPSDWQVVAFHYKILSRTQDSVSWSNTRQMKGKGTWGCHVPSETGSAFLCSNSPSVWSSWIWEYTLYMCMRWGSSMLGEDWVWDGVWDASGLCLQINTNTYAFSLIHFPSSDLSWFPPSCLLMPR